MGLMELIMPKLSRGCGEPDKILRSGDRLCLPPASLLFSESFPENVRFTLSATNPCYPLGTDYKRMACAFSTSCPPFSDDIPSVVFDLRDWCKTWRFHLADPAGGSNPLAARYSVVHYANDYSFPTSDFPSYNPCGIAAARPICGYDSFWLLFNWDVCLITSIITTNYAAAAYSPFQLYPTYRQIVVRLSIFCRNAYISRRVVLFMASEEIPGCNKYIRRDSFPGNSITFHPCRVYKTIPGEPNEGWMFEHETYEVLNPDNYADNFVGTMTWD